jgi:hypothetical protein
MRGMLQKMTAFLQVLHSLTTRAEQLVVINTMVITSRKSIISLDKFFRSGNDVSSYDHISQLLRDVSCLLLYPVESIG